MIETLRHHFDHCTIPQVERLFFLNQEFNTEAAARAKLYPTVASLTVNDQVIDKTTEFTSGRPIKAHLQKYFNPPAVKFTEKLNYRRPEHAGSIKIIPILDVCTVQGNIRLQEVDGGVDRVVDLDVRMRKRWFFIKWIAEKYILQSVAKSYNEIQDFTQNWINTHPEGKAA